MLVLSNTCYLPARCCPPTGSKNASALMSSTRSTIKQCDKVMCGGG